MKKNVVTVAKINENSILAVQTGTVPLKGIDVAYSHILVLTKTSVVHCGLVCKAILYTFCMVAAQSARKSKLHVSAPTCV